MVQELQLYFINNVSNSFKDFFMKNNWLLFLILFLPTYAIAEDWIQINDKGNTLIFVDRNSIKVADQYRIYTSKTILQKPEYFDKIGPVSEQHTKHISNCKNYSVSLISTKIYNPDKELVFNKENSNFKHTFNSVKRNSLGYDVVRFVCTHRPRRANL